MYGVDTITGLAAVQEDKKARELADALRTIEEYLVRSRAEISRKGRNEMTLNSNSLYDELKGLSKPS